MHLKDLIEAEGKGLTFVDIDETLFFTKSLIYVLDKDSKEILKKLTNTEFNVYSLADNEEFDYREFRDAEVFATTSDPIHNMINMVNIIYKRIKASNKGSQLHLLTARADFKDPHTFIKYLRSFGLDIGHMDEGKIHVIRSGNLEGRNSAVKKKKIIKEFLEKDNFTRVRLYDDAEINLKAFLELKDDFPDVSFEAIIIEHGKQKRYKKIN